MAIYYIDPIGGSDAYDGLSASTAKKTQSAVTPTAGDTVLFKRGSFLREKLQTASGEQGRPITYSSYGEGAKPIFCGSTDVSSEKDWVKTDKGNVWECVKPIPGDVGNYVFGDGECTATLRWSEDQLCAQGDFYDCRFAQGEHYRQRFTEQRVLMYSEGNPAIVYGRIECVSYNTRSLGTLCHDTVIDGIHFKNSGVHALAGQGDRIKVLNCDFENIGGCAWNEELQIRFGNGVEIWDHGDHITVEGCSFKNVYDSCVTHQGPGDRTKPAEYFICNGNVFDTYGMAAFEYRDKLPISSEFKNNVCKNAGCGFAMLGEVLPRKSEIWPQPMGHHIFMWRIPKATEGGSLVISDNVFEDAPVGAAIYSIISPEAEAQITLENNKYTANPVLLNRFGGENHTDLEAYKTATGKDTGSSYLD